MATKQSTQAGRPAVKSQLKHVTVELQDDVYAVTFVSRPAGLRSTKTLHFYACPERPCPPRGGSKGRVLYSDEPYLKVIETKQAIEISFVSCPKDRPRRRLKMISCPEYPCPPRR
jgi:hypothetical protein